MDRIWAIAINTFREAVRDRVLYGLLGGAVAVLLFTLVLAALSLDQQARLVHDLGLASISLFGVITAVFLGSSLLYKEIERKTLYVILPKPIRRHEFLIGKYLGITLTGAVFIALMGALQLWLSALQAGAPLPWLVSAPVALAALLGVGFARVRDRTSLLLPWSLVALAVGAVVAARAAVPLTPILGALALDLGEVAVVAAVALVFSSFSTPFLTGLLTFGVWIVGRSAESMATMQSRALPATLRSVLHGMARVVPNFSLFVPPRRALEGAVEGFGGPVEYVTHALTYGALYAALLVLFACVVFRRRDFA